jgi:methionine-rich copper-binding protein CopC
VLTNRYSIDKGLAVIQAILENDGRTVTLKTSTQQETVYNLTVANIPDLVGNVMDTSSNWMFGGIANPEISVQLQGLQAVDFNTVEVSFSRALTDNDVNNLKLTLLSDNGNGVNLNDWQSYVRRKSGTDKVVTVQYRTKESNPNLFIPGHVYVSRVTGVTGLTTTGDTDRAPFAGTSIVNREPFVTQVVALGKKQIKVIFSEHVKNVDEPAFRIVDKDGNKVNIDFDELNDKNKVVTEVNVRLLDELQAGKTYTMTFQPNIITDAAGWNGLKVSEGSGPYSVSFNGV